MMKYINVKYVEYYKLRSRPYVTVICMLNLHVIYIYIMDSKVDSILCHISYLYMNITVRIRDCIGYTIYRLIRIHVSIFAQVERTMIHEQLNT